MPPPSPKKKPRGKSPKKKPPSPLNSADSVLVKPPTMAAAMALYPSLIPPIPSGLHPVVTRVLALDAKIKENVVAAVDELTALKRLVNNATMHCPRSSTSTSRAPVQSASPVKSTAPSTLPLPPKDSSQAPPAIQLDVADTKVKTKATSDDVFIWPWRWAPEKSLYVQQEILNDFMAAHAELEIISHDVLTALTFLTQTPHAHTLNNFPSTSPGRRYEELRKELHALRTQWVWHDKKLVRHLIATEGIGEDEARARSEDMLNNNGIATREELCEKARDFKPGWAFVKAVKKSVKGKSIEEVTALMEKLTNKPEHCRRYETDREGKEKMVEESEEAKNFREMMVKDFGKVIGVKEMTVNKAHKEGQNLQAPWDELYADAARWGSKEAKKAMAEMAKMMEDVNLSSATVGKVTISMDAGNEVTLDELKREMMKGIE
ncbi:MAG: hypothetical protein Q9218_005219, partial [Villophora microphyllina]